MQFGQACIFYCFTNPSFNVSTYKSENNCILFIFVHQVVKLFFQSISQEFPISSVWHAATVRKNLIWSFIGEFSYGQIVITCSGLDV